MLGWLEVIVVEALRGGESIFGLDGMLWNLVFYRRIDQHLNSGEVTRAEDPGAVD